MNSFVFRISDVWVSFGQLAWQHTESSWTARPLNFWCVSTWPRKCDVALLKLIICHWRVDNHVTDKLHIYVRKASVVVRSFCSLLIQIFSVIPQIEATPAVLEVHRSNHLLNGL